MMTKEIIPIWTGLEGTKNIINIYQANLLDIVLVNSTNSSGTILKGQPLFHSKIIHWNLLK